MCLTANHTLIFGATVPDKMLHTWTEGGQKEHVIGLVELYAVLVALRSWKVHVAGQRVLLFVDNWPVVDALVKGVSTQATWRDMLMVFEAMDEELQALLWVGRVPSSSNPSDPPSRGTLDGLDFLRPFDVCNGICPVMNVTLQALVKETG